MLLAEFLSPATGPFLTLTCLSHQLTHEQILNELHDLRMCYLNEVKAFSLQFENLSITQQADPILLALVVNNYTRPTKGSKISDLCYKVV